MVANTYLLSYLCDSSDDSDSRDSSDISDFFHQQTCWQKNFFLLNNFFTKQPFFTKNILTKKHFSQKLV